MSRACLYSIFIAGTVVLVIGVSAFPKKPYDYYFWEGVRAYENHDYDRAIAYFSEMIRRNPKAAVLSAMRGKAYYAKGSYDEAIADFSQALQLSPKDRTNIYNSRGEAYSAKERYDLAMKDFSEALRLEPKDIRALVRRGDLYSDTNENEKALADYGEALRINATHSYPHSARALVYKRLKNYDKAIADYEIALQLNPKNIHALNGLAWLQATCPVEKIRDGKKALVNAKMANQLSDWKEPFDLGTLAAAYAEIGQFDEAIKWAKKALEYSGTYSAEVEKMDRRALVLYEKGKPYRDD